MRFSWSNTKRVHPSSLLTGERVVALIVFVDPPVVLAENLESLTELLCGVHFVVLFLEEKADVQSFIRKLLVGMATMELKSVHTNFYCIVFFFSNARSESPHRCSRNFLLQ